MQILNINLLFFTASMLLFKSLAYLNKPYAHYKLIKLNMASANGPTEVQRLSVKKFGMDY